MIARSTISLWDIPSMSLNRQVAYLGFKLEHVMFAVVPPAAFRAFWIFQATGVCFCVYERLSHVRSGSPLAGVRGSRCNPYELRFCISAMALIMGCGETEVRPLNGRSKMKTRATSNVTAKP
jgi:hypothetical protein